MRRSRDCAESARCQAIPRCGCAGATARRWQRRTATLTALGYFVLFLVLSAFAPSLMTGTAAGGVPTGLLLAVGQVPVTWLAVALYEATARRRVDPLAALIRRQAVVDARREAVR